jgi:acyl carrier protein
MTKVTNEQVAALVSLALQDLGRELQQPSLEKTGRDTRLIGAHSALDSIALVSLIADIEARIASEFGRDIVLADESAMSAMRSPFRNAGALADHICARLNAEPG